eukprot:15485745-Alexandrium_andersonii.AAC.1
MPKLGGRGAMEKPRRRVPSPKAHGGKDVCLRHPRNHEPRAGRVTRWAAVRRPAAALARVAQPWAEAGSLKAHAQGQATRCT